MLIQFPFPYHLWGLSPELVGLLDLSYGAVFQPTRKMHRGHNGLESSMPWYNDRVEGF